jgi:hypothetical protein
VYFIGGRLAMTSCFVVLSIIHARERDSDGKKRGGDEDDEREREREREKGALWVLKMR